MEFFRLFSIKNHLLIIRSAKEHGKKVQATCFVQDNNRVNIYQVFTVYQVLGSAVYELFLFNLHNPVR